MTTTDKTTPSAAELDRRNAILDAAAAVFSEHGYAATTMDAVALKAGISKGSIYNYFHNKRDLFAKLFTRAMQQQGDAAEEIMRLDAPAAERVQRLLEFWFERLGQNKTVVQLGIEFWATAAREDAAGEMTIEFNQLYASWRQKLAAMLEQGVRAGEFPQTLRTEVAAGLLMAILDGLEVQTAVGLSVAIDSQFVESLKRAVLAALRSPGEAS